MRWILIDRLVDCTPGERAVAIKTFSRSEILFMDHFVGLPTVPGVLQIEMIAQTAGKCIKVARPNSLTLLGVVRSAKFFSRIEPGDQCRITVDIDRMRADYALASGQVEVSGVRVSRAELVVAIVASPTSSVDDPIIQDWKRRQAGQREHDTLEASAHPVAR